MTDWIQGEVLSNTHWTDNLFSLQINASIPEFEAGQYLYLGLDNNGERLAQPYSLLNAPDERPLEFFFYTHLEGDLSTSFHQLRAGDTIWVATRAEGDFTLSRVPDAENLWLLATGTGIAPFLSMLKTDEPWQRFEHIVVVYAARYMADMRYTDIFDELHARFPGRLSIIPFISREKIADAVHGHIPAAIENGLLAKTAHRELLPENSQVMLCGNPGMVKDAVTALKSKGFSENNGDGPGQLSFESYW